MKTEIIPGCSEGQGELERARQNRFLKISVNASCSYLRISVPYFDRRFSQEDGTIPTTTHTI